jgi:hypothetical protein
VNGAPARNSTFSRVLAILSIAGMLVWAALTTLMIAIAGMGGGPTGAKAVARYSFGYSGSVYLLLLSSSCLPFVRGVLLVVTGIVAHLILAAFAVYLLADSGPLGLILLAPFFAFAVGWFVLARRKLCDRL